MSESITLQERADLMAVYIAMVAIYFRQSRTNPRFKTDEGIIRLADAANYILSIERQASKKDKAVTRC